MVLIGNLNLTTIGVVGGGTMGRAIAWLLAKKLAPLGIKIVLVDISQDALDKAKAWCDALTDKLVSRDKLTEYDAEAMKRLFTYTTHYNDLNDCGFVIEAATENFDLKEKIFANLEDVCGPEAILASNTSHMPRGELAKKMKFPERYCVLHHFNPAEHSNCVEVVTAPSDKGLLVLKKLSQFLELIGRIPIEVKDEWAFGGNRIFEGMVHAVLVAVEEDLLGTTREVDYLAREAFGSPVGPLTVLNMIPGSNELTRIGLEGLEHASMIWYEPTDLLRAQGNTPWDVVGRDDPAPEIDPERRKAIVDQLRGAFLGLCGRVMEDGICSESDLELLVTSALAAKGPVAMMNELGIAEAARLVQEYARDHEMFEAPAYFGPTPFIPHLSEVVVDYISVDEEEVGGKAAVVRIRRPHALNALSEKVYADLRWLLPMLDLDEDVVAVVITGYGPKAAIAGADLRQLHEILQGDNPKEDAIRRSKLGQSVGDAISQMSTPVGFAINGLLLGGGLELALACDLRVAVRDVQLIGSPETTLGLIPGAGATQRLLRWTNDLQWASDVLRSGLPYSAETAHAKGIVDTLCDAGNLIDTTITLLLDRDTWPSFEDGPLNLSNIKRTPLVELTASMPNDKRPDPATDQICISAIARGAATTIREGLKIESERFGRAAVTDVACERVARFVGKPNFKAQEQLPEPVHA